MSASHGEALSELRLRLLANGYEPVPIIGPAEPVRSAGKRPRLSDWASCEINPAAIRQWGRDLARDVNTGIRCGVIQGVDIDVPEPGLARSIEDLAFAMLGPTPLRRVGKAPKVLLAYQAAEPLPKAETAEFFLPDGTKLQVEVLGKGQQFVSHGVHPDTGQPYVWTAQAPETTPLPAVPLIEPGRLRAFLAACEAIFREAGGRTAKEIEAASRPAPELARTEPRQGSGDGFFREVNNRALANADRWVRSVFPGAYWQANATTPPGAWRVSSADLGRGLEEDIAIHVREGIQDFGTRESLTAIDLVIRHAGAPDAPAAALYLCELLQVDPESIGWKARKKPADTLPPSTATRAEGPAPGTGKPKILPLILWRDVNPATEGADFVQGLLVEGAMSVIYGPSNCGKTFFMTDLALHVALGRDWKGRKIDPGAVIYCALEGSHGIQNRVAAFRLKHGLTGCDVPFAIIPVALNLLDPEAHTDPLIETIQHVANTFNVPVRMTVLDTLSRAMAGGNENSPEDMGALVTNGDRIRQATNSHVAWIHHSGKDQAQGARGHSLLRAATDTEIEISRPDKNSPSTAKVTKQREMPIEGDWAFGLENVQLGTDRWGAPVTSCVVTEADAVQKNSLDLPPGARAGMVALHEALIAAGQKPMSRDIPDWALVTPLEAWRREFYARSHLSGQEAKKKAFQRAIKDLRDKGLVAVMHDQAWLTERNHAH